MALTAAFFWAVAMILMRKISRNESSLVIVFSVNGFYIVVLGPIAAFLWQPMELWMVGSVIGVGIIGGLAQFVLIVRWDSGPCGFMGVRDEAGQCQRTGN